MPPRQKIEPTVPTADENPPEVVTEETPVETPTEPSIETHIPEPAPSPDPHTGLVDEAAAQAHAQQAVAEMKAGADEPGKTFTFGDGHQCDYVTDYDFLPSCNCRVEYQICRLCYTRL